ncbi:MAG: RdgB/HAM1 family non-canonical purine NTP pyrophosphatase [Candidatus Thorarchaeota archaeon]
MVLVTQNRYKIAELQPLFQNFKVTFETTDIEKYEIRSNDVSRVALEAASQAHMTLEKPVVVDDTGLYIKALNGFPGAYAAYVLHTIGKEGILRLMHGVVKRDAIFRTAVSFVDVSQAKIFVGEMEGKIAETAAGEEGFGYDPIFIPEGMDITYAQLSFEDKTAISHRTKAFTQFLDWYSFNKS